MIACCGRSTCGFNGLDNSNQRLVRSIPLFSGQYFIVLTSLKGYYCKVCTISAITCEIHSSKGSNSSRETFDSNKRMAGLICLHTKPHLKLPI